MKRFIIILGAYAALATYPAYLQADRTVNAWLDDFAEARVGMTIAQSDDLVQIAQALPEHLKAPLPIRKGGE